MDNQFALQYATISDVNDLRGAISRLQLNTLDYVVLDAEDDLIETKDKASHAIIKYLDDHHHEDVDKIAAWVTAFSPYTLDDMEKAFVRKGSLADYARECYEENTLAVLAEYVQTSREMWEPQQRKEALRMFRDIPIDWDRVTEMYSQDHTESGGFIFRT